MLQYRGDELRKYLIKYNIFPNKKINEFDQNIIDMAIDLMNLLKTIGENIKQNKKPENLTDKGFEQMRLHYVYLRKAVPKELTDELLLQISKESYITHK